MGVDVGDNGGGVLVGVEVGVDVGVADGEGVGEGDADWSGNAPSATFEMINAKS